MTNSDNLLLEQRIGQLVLIRNSKKIGRVGVVGGEDGYGGYLTEYVDQEIFSHGGEERRKALAELARIRREYPEKRGVINEVENLSRYGWWKAEHPKAGERVEGFLGIAVFASIMGSIGYINYLLNK